MISCYLCTSTHTVHSTVKCFSVFVPNLPLFHQKLFCHPFLWCFHSWYYEHYKRSISTSLCVHHTHSGNSQQCALVCHVTTPLLTTCQALARLFYFLWNIWIINIYMSLVTPQFSLNYQKYCKHNTYVVNSGLMMSQMVEFCYLQMQ